MTRRKIGRVLLLVGAIAVGVIIKCQPGGPEINRVRRKPKGTGSLSPVTPKSAEISDQATDDRSIRWIRNLFEFFSRVRQHYNRKSSVSNKDNDTVDSSVFSESFSELSCSSLDSCQACAANRKCDWCGAKISVSLPMLKLNNDFIPTGVCRPKTVKSCADVQFGDFQKSLNKKVRLLMVAVVTLGFEVVPVNAESAWCTAVRHPEEVTAESCGDCVARGKGYTWCNIDLEIRKIGPKLASPHTCLRPELAFACSNEIIPATLGFPFNMLNVNMKVAKNLSECGQLVAPVSPLPAPICSDNHSCDACGRSTASGGCTWCGGKLRFNVNRIDVAANIQGVCLLGRDTKCDAVHIGTITDAINSIPGNFLKFSVVPMAKSNSEKDYCTNVQWDPRAANTCPKCLKKPNSVWCQIDGTVTALQRMSTDLVYLISGEKTTSRFHSRSDQNDETESANKGFHGGLCIPEGLSFICDTFIPGFSATYMVKSCPQE